MASPPRPPRVFDPGDPALAPIEPEDAPSSNDGAPGAGEPAPSPPRAARLSLAGVFVWASGSLFALASGLWFARYIAIAIERRDAIGWLAFALLATALAAALMLILREIVGLARLGRLAHIRAGIEAALASDPKSERAAVRRLRSLYDGRPELKWALARLAEHDRDVRDPGDLARLAEREIVAPLDKECLRRVMASAKRVGVVTAMSPSGVISVLFVLYENLRLLRALAGLYGGRPGALGGLTLARMVMGHIVATSGIALTDDLFGQFLGHDLLRRVSRRLGEGAFNSALTARVGVAAMHVCRPMPFLDAPPARLRGLLPELLRGLRREPAANNRPAPPGPGSR